jgi:adenine-specific DNA-methyltransferase
MSVLESQTLIESKTRASRHELGQFLTPLHVADFMASLFQTNRDHWDLLDAGAGTGALTAAFVRRICTMRNKPRSLSVTAFELDPVMFEALRDTLAECWRLCDRTGVAFSSTIRFEDFIEAAAPMAREDLFSNQQLRFNVAIVNPPYRKIRSDSPTRLCRLDRQAPDQGRGAGCDHPAKLLQRALL